MKIFNTTFEKAGIIFEVAGYWRPATGPRTNCLPGNAEEGDNAEIFSIKDVAVNDSILACDKEEFLNFFYDDILENLLKN